MNKAATAPNPNAAVPNTNPLDSSSYAAFSHALVDPILGLQAPATHSPTRIDQDYNELGNTVLQLSSSISGPSSPRSLAATVAADAFASNSATHDLSHHGTGLVHRRPTSSRQSGSPPTYTPNGRILYTRPSNPYPNLTEMFRNNNHQHLLSRRRPQSSLMGQALEEDQRLEALWESHGVGGSAHLGLGPPSRHAPISDVAFTEAGFEEWNPSTLSFTKLASWTPTDTSASVDQLTFPYTADRIQDTIMSPDDEAHGMSLTPPEPLQAGVDQSWGDKSLEDATGELQHTGDGSTEDSGNADHSFNDHAHDEDLDDHKLNEGPESSSKTTHNNFVNKLFNMISDPKASEYIAWTELGTSFIVSSVGEFSRSILGQHFKHSNFSSFVRQLNMYGFHKINRTPRNQRPQGEAQRWEFSHPKFLRGRPDLLEDIKRKSIEPDPSTSRQRLELPSEVAATLRGMSAQHAATYKALREEQAKVKKLVHAVKLMYDMMNASGFAQFPLQFPQELLQDSDNAITENGQSYDDEFPGIAQNGLILDPQISPTGRAIRRPRNALESSQPTALRQGRSSATTRPSLGSNGSPVRR